MPKFPFFLILLSLLSFSCEKESLPTFIGEWVMTQSSFHDCNDFTDNFILVFDENGQFCDEGLGTVFCISRRYIFTETEVSIINTSESAITPIVIDTITGTYSYNLDYTLEMCFNNDCTDGLYNLSHDDFAIQLDANADDCIASFWAVRR